MRLKNTTTGSNVEMRQHVQLLGHSAYGVTELRTFEPRPLVAYSPADCKTIRNNAFCCTKLRQRQVCDMSGELQSIRQKREMLKAELEAARAQFRGGTALCPFHEDHKPSGGVYRGEDGAWRYKCQSCGLGGDVLDIRARRTGRSLAEVLSEANNGVNNSRTGTAAAISTRASTLTNTMGLCWRCYVRPTQIIRKLFLQVQAS